jgi:hypothetical protein
MKNSNVHSKPIATQLAGKIINASLCLSKDDRFVVLFPHDFPKKLEEALWFIIVYSPCE